MIPLKQLRENKAAIVAGLQKRNFKQTKLIDTLLSLDEKRRKTQTELDQQLAEANQLAKEIGQLFKSGKADEAQERKARSGELKSSTKVLQEDLQTTAQEMLEIRYQIPNVPQDSVPAGTTEEDNEEIESGGALPQLPEGHSPTGNWPKNTTSSTLIWGVKSPVPVFPYTKEKERVYNGL